MTTKPEPPRYLPMTAEEIAATLNEIYQKRLFIVGMTGSGKSHLIKRLWERGPRDQLRFIYDSKGLFDVDGRGNPDPLTDQIKIGGENAARKLIAWLRRHDTSRTIVFQPGKRLIEGPGAIRYADHILGICYEYCQERFENRRSRPWAGFRGYVDELSCIATANTIPAHWTAFTSRGRAIHAAMWGGSQRPCRIPFNAMSESEVKLVGHLDMQKDLDRVAEEMGCYLFRQSPQVEAERHGARENSPDWFSFWLRYGRKIALVHV